MGAKYTAAQRAATDKYMKNKKTLRVIVTDERKMIIEEHAKSINESVSSFINRAIDEAMKRDKSQE